FVGTRNLAEHALGEIKISFLDPRTACASLGIPNGGKRGIVLLAKFPSFLADGRNNSLVATVPPQEVQDLITQRGSDGIFDFRILAMHRYDLPKMDSM